MSLYYEVPVRIAGYHIVFEHHHTREDWLGPLVLQGSSFLRSIVLYYGGPVWMTDYELVPE